jgi:hypothetical protein
MGAQSKTSLGQAIDTVIDALQGLDDAARLIAVKAACEHLNIAVVPPGAGPQAEIPLDVTPAPPPPPGTLQHKIVDIRSLRESKRPSKAIEMACVVAYYLENLAPPEERRAEIMTKDVQKYFKQADFPLPKVPGQVLVDAKGAGYLDSARRGKYKLNPVGHNLVAHSLPRVKGKK